MPAMLGSGGHSGPNRFAARFQEPMWGWIALALLGYFAGSFLAAQLSMQPSGLYGMGSALVLIVFGVIWRRSRQERLKHKAHVLRRELGKLEGQLTDLKVAEAKANGDFDKFGSSE